MPANRPLRESDFGSLAREVKNLCRAQALLAMGRVDEARDLLAETKPDHPFAESGGVG